MYAPCSGVYQAHYPRTELGEAYQWDLMSQSGTLSVTESVNMVPTLSSGLPGTVTIGQIKGTSTDCECELKFTVSLID